MKFIMQMIDIKQIKGIYTDRYYEKLSINLQNEDKEKNRTIVTECGKFSAVYSTKNYNPIDSFGLGSWRGIHTPTEISFYGNEQLLFTKMSLNQPCLILQGCK